MIGVLGITGYFTGIWKSIEMLMRKQIRLNDGRFCLPSNEIVWLSLEMPTSQYKLLGSNVSFGVPTTICLVIQFENWSI